jgi:TonB family protein
MKALFVMATLLLAGAPVPLLSMDDNAPPADTGQAFDRSPVVLHQVAPKYPESMLKGGWEGTVYVKALIGVNGDVVEAEVVKTTVSASNGNEGEDQGASSSKEFRESSLAAVKQWKFAAAQFQGKPVSAWVTIPFRFKLSTDGKISQDETIIKKTVKDILDGTADTKKLVTDKADLIYEKQQVNLLDALNGKYPKISLFEGKDAVCVESSVSSLGDGNALVIWKSRLPKGKGERFHTVQLQNIDNAWKVVHWHVSW